MTRPLVLQVLVLLLAGTLVGYLLRGATTSPPPAVPSAPERREGAPASRGEESAGRLATDAALWSRLDALEARIVALEAAPAAGASEGAGVPARGDDGGAETRAEVLTPAALARFRALREEVERQDELARELRHARNVLLGSGVALAPDELERVVAVTAEFKNRVDEELQAASRGGRTQAEKDEILRVIQEDYQRALERVVALGTVERIIERMGPVPGYPRKRR